MLEHIKEMYKKYIGQKVEKTSHRPFKSQLRKNTVKEVVRHPYLKERFAFTFEEDDSVVEISKCRLVEMETK